jgi:hypothetical protein
MGSRGAFVDVNKNDFSFVDGGQNYHSIGTLSTDKNVKILLQQSGAVKAPEYSHTAERIYAVVQKGTLKHIAFYDENHNQSKVIDLWHSHGKDKLMPHIHYNLDHADKGIPISEEDKKLILKIRKEYNLK